MSTKREQKGKNRTHDACPLLHNIRQTIHLDKQRAELTKYRAAARGGYDEGYGVELDGYV